jgi:hypothetical protein
MKKRFSLTLYWQNRTEAGGAERILPIAFGGKPNYEFNAAEEC